MINWVPVVIKSNGMAGQTPGVWFPGESTLRYLE
jgi:hypothetical protein